ncbi:hypothetical protein HDV05_004668 [Chytridiales sp. JEL 0842]|nr:hypothetical protein HDV05_004668 [Chytridiales sp. JEL 0842]
MMNTTTQAQSQSLTDTQRAQLSEYQDAIYFGLLAEFIPCVLTNDFCKHLAAGDLTELMYLFHDNCIVTEYIPPAPRSEEQLSAPMFKRNVPSGYYQYQGKDQIRSWLEGWIKVKSKLTVDSKLLRADGLFEAEQVTLRNIMIEGYFGGTTGVRANMTGEVKDFQIFLLMLEFNEEDILRISNGH